MKVISVSATGLILFFSVPSFAQEWIEYKNSVDSFAVTLPREPAIKDTKFTTEYGHVLPGHLYTIDDGKNHYSVSVIDFTNLR